MPQLVLRELGMRTGDNSKKERAAQRRRARRRRRAGRRRKKELEAERASLRLALVSGHSNRPVAEIHFPGVIDESSCHAQRADTFIVTFD